MSTRHLRPRLARPLVAFTLMIAAGCATALTPVPAGTWPRAIADFYRVYEGAYDLWPQVVTLDYRAEINGRLIPDAAVGLAFIQAFGAAFPDLRYQVEEMIVAGDRVTTRWRATGTHAGTFLGIDPTGRAVTMHGISVFALRDERIAEVWSVWDRAGLMEQLTAP